jgi:predicted phosphodiesterase
MKIIIFSDTHLSHKFDVRKYNFLKRIISESDRVIINGDFWDRYRTTFDKFVSSEWKKLFPLFLKKKTVYIHGNHDPEELCNDRMQLFSVINSESYEFRADGHSFIVHHGDRIVEQNKPRIIKFYGIVMGFISKINVERFIQRIFRITIRIGYWILGADFMTTTSISKNNNRVMKNSHDPATGKWQVCSDTHCSELDAENLFINTGCILYGWGSYLLIDGTNIKLIKEKY